MYLEQMWTYITLNVISLTLKWFVGDSMLKLYQDVVKCSSAIGPAVH